MSRKDQFIKDFMPYAQEQGARLGIDPRLILAQSAIETGWGAKAPGNNYFGIKSHGKKGGQTFATHEVINGQRVAMNDSFRGYGSAEDSFRGYGDFLTENPRYGEMLKAKGLGAQVAALSRSGYATDPQYGNKVMAIANKLDATQDVAQNAQSEQEEAAPERDYTGVHKAYFNNSMKPEHREKYIDALKSGEIPHQEIPKGVYEAYVGGKMKPEHMSKFEQAVNDGVWVVPTFERETQNGSTIPRAEEYGNPTETNLKRGFGEEILRQVGLTGRAAVEGGATTVGVFSNPITALINMMRDDESQIPFAREAIGNLLTQAGVPEPETMTERIVQEIGGALSGTGAAIKVAEGTAKVATGVTKAVAQSMAAAPTSQAASTIAGEAAGQAAQYAGVGPVGQVFANVVAGGAGGSIGGKNVKAPRGNAREIIRPDTSPEHIGTLTRDANINKPRTLEKLAEIADIDQGAVKAADDLGIDLPADVFSNNEHLKQAAGLGRSDLKATGSGIWAQTVKNAIGKADEIIGKFANKDGIAGMSDDVKASLNATRDNLKGQSKRIYNKVDASISKDKTVEPDNIVKFLNNKVKELGGESGLSPAEKKLLDFATDPNQKLTYGRLLREKGYVGKALARSESPYGSMLEADLSNLYDAMRLDQMATVKRLGSDELGQELAQANTLYTKQKDLEKTIIKGFGKEGNGSIAKMLDRAIKTSSKGDNAELNKILSIIPKDLQREAMLTGIANLSKSAVVAEQGFGFAQYAKFYSSLRDNKPVYAQIKSIVGKDAADMMQNMYVVSKRITEARGNVIKTGKANQALVQTMTAESFMRRMVSSSLGRRSVKLSATGIGAQTGGVAGAIGGNAIADIIIESGKGSSRINAANKVFSSDEFKRIAVELGATGRASKKNMIALAKTKAFKNWAKKVSIDEPNRWLAGVVNSSQQKENKQ